MMRKNKMNKKNKVLLLLCIGVVVFGITIGSIVLLNISKSMVIQPVSNIDINKVADGTYLGSAKNEIIKVKVRVTIKDRNIINIDILKHDNGLGKKAEIIIDDVTAKQSLEVDTISSATYSSNIILKAIENALMKGVVL